MFAVGVHTLRTMPELLSVPPSLPAIAVSCTIPREDHGCGVALIHHIPHNKHVSGRAAWVGEVTFLRNHYCVPYLAVHKVNLEVGVRQRPPPAALHREYHQP